ncbi:heavy-metal-associated domain-containing protein [Hufsiella ginkgonis]|uniref:HMA domain-containing protein n=1 Tax=Hufsiella ginkgonis TaxID=2695274 RepID=A0A7K1XZR8_9SPHI|nr:hypothetical protein [Hufsiella ginkgonis]MXV16298.1 hypothetical protein [Hufsiella ginkgonis]
METLNFKTNINCSGCVTAVTPFLHKEENILKWKVDTDHPANILTVEVQNIGEGEVVKLIKKAGFDAERI